MKKTILLYVLFVSMLCNGQLKETFSDGDFTHNPTWYGSTTNFIVGADKQLHSKASTASTSYLFTPSTAMNNASWECQLMFDYPTSSSNYSCIYIVSNKQSIENGLNGYFVQVGGTNDEVSLYLQEGTKKTKIIDGIDKRTDLKPLKITIKVTRDSSSVFSLYSKLSTENDFLLEGTAENKQVQQCSYFGLSYTNTSTTGKSYSFDNIEVSGVPIEDQFSPEWLTLAIQLPSTIQCVFSEPIIVDQLSVRINDSQVSVLSQQLGTDKTELLLQTDFVFEEGKLFHVQLEGLTDLSGNTLANKLKTYAAVEQIAQGDIIFNEVMFHQPDSSFEYIELYNRSERLIGLSGLVLTTLKADGSLNAGHQIPEGAFIAPKGCIAITQNAAIVKAYHQCPIDANIVQSTWTALNNELSTLLLTNALKDTIYDEFSYNASMHHVMIKNPKGVSLERIYTDLLSTDDITNWHSAAFVNNYGTPGFMNSQYREHAADEGGEQPNFYLENKVFSPDNDGVDDVCVLKYTSELEGYLANILVLSANGERIFNLAANQLLGSSGQLIWDGRNSAGKVANVGIYVIFVQLFQAELGKRKQFKIPLVLSSR